MTKILTLLLFGLSLVVVQAQVVPPISNRSTSTEADIRRLQNEINGLDHMPNVTQEQRQARQKELFLRLKQLEDNHRREKEVLESVKFKGTIHRSTIDYASGVDLSNKPPFWDGITLPNRLVLYTAKDLHLDKKTEERLRHVAQFITQDKFPLARREFKNVLAEHADEPAEPFIHYVVRIKYIEHSDLESLAQQIDKAKESNNTTMLSQIQSQFNKTLDSKIGLTVAIQKTLFFLIEISKETFP